jgi:hypothetical protein
MFNVDDIVKYKRAFLQNTGWYTNVPQDGKVVGPGSLKNTVLVHWCDREEPVLVNVANLVLAQGAWDPN